MKGLSKSLLFFFLTTTGWLLIVPAQAQSDIRLEKLLRKKKFEKVIRFSQKRLQNGEDDSIAHYYLLAALVDKSSRARGTAGVPDFEKAFRHYDQYPNVHFSASHERQLKPKFRAAAVRERALSAAAKKITTNFFMKMNQRPGPTASSLS